MAAFKPFQIIIILILLSGVILGIYLIGNPTRFLPKAASEPISNPVNPSPSTVSGPINNSPKPSSSTSPDNPNYPQTNLGDINGNGRIDIFDFNFVVTYFGQTGVDLPPDINKNGRVDIFDFNTIVTHFGKKITDILKENSIPLTPPAGYKWTDLVVDYDGSLLNKCLINAANQSTAIPQNIISQFTSIPIYNGYWWTFQQESSGSGLNYTAALCLSRVDCPNGRNPSDNQCLNITE